jgi:hypothetical protein
MKTSLLMRGEFPSKNIVYAGDGLTDIPCFLLVKSSGQAFGVFDPALGEISRFSDDIDIGFRNEFRDRYLCSQSRALLPENQLPKILEKRRVRCAEIVPIGRSGFERHHLFNRGLFALLFGPIHPGMEYCVPGELSPVVRFSIGTIFLVVECGKRSSRKAASFRFGERRITC